LSKWLFSGRKSIKRCDKVYDKGQKTGFGALPEKAQSEFSVSALPPPINHAFTAAQENFPERKLIPCPMEKTGIQSLGMQSILCVLVSSKSRLQMVQTWSNRNND
jgi:hypothetical protein